MVTKVEEIIRNNKVKALIDLCFSRPGKPCSPQANRVFRDCHAMGNGQWAVGSPQSTANS